MFYHSATMAQGDPDAGAQKVQSCGICHGADGNSMNPMWPKLAGQHPEYTVKQLNDFKTGNRSNPQMSPMAAALSEQDMMDIAAFYGLQTPAETQVPASMNESEVELGQKVYRAGDATKNLASCMACHGPRGMGNSAAGYPMLAGQHAAYTAAQLQAFKNSSRANDANSVMRDIALKMSDQEIEAVSEYLQGLY
ncbi:MAG: cytochrome c4 [Gammaproteobacteria bacterium]|nr:cytochrome c4 [Gammaproteobacteria bacterium]